MLFFHKWEHWAISKCFIFGGFTCTSLLPIYGRSIKWRKNEERQLMKWVGIFQVRIFWMGIFPGRIFLAPLLLNHSIAPSLCFSNNLNNSFKSLFAAQIVLSSEKFPGFAWFTKNNKSLICWTTSDLGWILEVLLIKVSNQTFSVFYFHSLLSSFHIRVNDIVSIERP